MKQFRHLIILIFLCVACESEFSSPETINNDLNFTTTSSLLSITNALDSFEENIVTFTDDLIVEGYVISTDRGGNFFKELIIQDRTENPTVGIAIQIDESSLFQRFPFGSHIYIKLNGLSIAYQNGVIELGHLNETEIDRLSPFLIDEHIFRTGEVLNITPSSSSLTTINESLINTYQKIESIQFPEELLDLTPITLAAENTDSFDGLRPMFNCETEVELLLSTSVFADFKTFEIPENTLNIEGVLTRDFDNIHYVLKMNSIENLSFVNENRCENIYFECNPNSFEATDILFNQDFENITNEVQLEPLGWIDLNITGDEERWEDRKITNIDNRVMTISAFNTGLQPLNAWLVTPEIDITNTTNNFIQFRVRTLFNNGNALKVWITDNFNENIENTNWELLEVDLPRNTSNYVTIQHDISCLTGNVRLAFEYTGYDSIITSTYQIDDVIFYGTITE